MAVPTPSRPATSVSAAAGGDVWGRRARWGLAGILAVAAANWLLWASAVPFGEAPDEPSHLEVAQFIATQGRLPVFGPTGDMYVRLDQVGIPIESHALAPPLPYLVDGALIRLGLVPPVAAARLGSLAATLVALALLYRLAARLLPGQPALALGVVGLVAAVPEVSFLAAVVNSDIFALAAALAVACLWPHVVRPLGALAFGLALGLALLTKYTSYPVALLSLLAAGWQVGRQQERVGVRLGRLALVVLGAGGVAGPWLVHNWHLYGEPWPLRLSEAAFRALQPPVPVSGAPGTQQLLSLEYAASWWQITFRSFWAGFGRVELFPPGWTYMLLLVGLAVGGLGLWGVAARRPLDFLSAAWLFLVGWLLSSVLAVFVASLGRYYPAHGRYLLVALPPLAVGLVLGWSHAAPQRWRAAAPWGLVAAMAAFNLYCLLGVVVPHYYGPTATRLIVTVDTPRPGDLVAAPVALRGWAVVAGRDRWAPGWVGGPPAWYAPAAEVEVTVDDIGSSPPRGGLGVARPDLVRALGAPGVLHAGFAYWWEPHGATPGVRTLTVCASDPAAATVCVHIPVQVAVPGAVETGSGG
ncbi:MAG TPA: hypothetical protein VFB73_06955 [Chloroflexota bacterium]|nr:hypothetical protein [Chloroflexota bacterium]